MLSPSSIFHALYYGTIHPWETSITKPTTAYETAATTACLLEEKLLSSLAKESQEQLRALLEENAMLSSCYAEEKFKEGFILGAKLMIETFSEK